MMMMMMMTTMTKIQWKLSLVSGNPREKGVHNWSWPLTGTENIEFVWELRKSGFCEGGSE